MSNPVSSPPVHNTSHSSYRWLNATVWSIVGATFFSDVSHEMATAILPLFLTTVGLGPGALGMMEGLSDLLLSVSKFAGGWLGHHAISKRPWLIAGYSLTTVCTAGMACWPTYGWLITMRGLAWIGRGFRSPLRDDLLASVVPQTHYGRVYGLERAGDMLGAVLGPLLAALLVWMDWSSVPILLVTLVPGMLAVLAISCATAQESVRNPQPEQMSDVSVSPAARSQQSWRALPPTFWWFLLAVGVFGLSDYARSFLIWLALQALGAHTSSANTPSAQTMLSLSMLLYAGHNLLSGMVAYPLGWWGDRWSRRHLLVIGYALGMVSNALLWLCGVGVISIILVMVLSALMLAAEETLEKAVAAQLLPVDLRSLGLGLLAAVNALGDMMSSLMLGWWLQQGQHAWAFAVATVLAACGTCLLGFLPRHFERSSSVVPHH